MRTPSAVTFAALTVLSLAVSSAAATSAGCGNDDNVSASALGSTTIDLGAGDPGPGGVRFAASGEAFALTGYAFPPPGDDSTSFVDGWAVRFSHIIVTVDNLTLAENPDAVPGDQSQTGALLARLSGPWAIDLARSDPSYLAGKGGAGELAVPFASLKIGSLKTDGTRYAFGFDAVPATASAKMVNITGDATAAYAKMETDGCVIRYMGTATFMGDKTSPTCFPDDHKDWPELVDFDFCFKTPTTYLNCQNPDNAPARPLADEEDERGIALKGDSSAIAQVTMHTDHPFWDSVLHDSPAHFNQFAARVVGQDAGAGAPTVTLDTLRGVDYTAVADALGRPVTWRYCIEPPTDVHAKLIGQMKFNPQTVPHAPASNPASGFRDYYDFASYIQSTQGHLNSDGLCFVTRNYPSPP